MPTSIDGNIVMGSITVGSVSLAAGANLIGKVQVEDGANPSELNIAAGAAESFSSIANNDLNTAVTVTGAATLLLAANPNRRVAVFTNKSITPGEIVYLGGATVALGEGVPITPGESYEDTKGGTVWYGRAAAGTPSVAVYEAEKV